MLVKIKFQLTFLLYLHHFMLINVKHSTFSNNGNRALCEIPSKNYVSSTSKLVCTKTVCKPVCIVICKKPVIFFLFTSLLALVILVSVCCSISCKPVNALISSEPAKSFVTCKPVCFSIVSVAKNLILSITVWLSVLSIPQIFFSSAVRNSVVPYRSACPADFDIAVQTVNITLLCF